MTITFNPDFTAFLIRFAMMGCASVVFDPINSNTSALSKSSSVFVGKPLPKTVARPATLGACQVRLHPSMLLLPRTVLINFWVIKLDSLVVLAQANIEMAFGPNVFLIPDNLPAITL
jgi:hypothetical protein